MTVQCPRSDTCCFGHYNRSSLLSYILPSTFHYFTPSLSLDRGGGGKSLPRSNVLRAAPKASWVGWYLEVGPHLLPNLVMCLAFQNQVLCHFFCAATAGTCNGVLTPNTMEVRCQQRTVAKFQHSYMLNCKILSETATKHGHEDTAGQIN